MIQLLSLRALVATQDEGVADLFRQAAAASPVPLEMVDAADASAVASLGGGCDLAYIDYSLPPPKIAAIVAKLRASEKPPFSILLAGAAAGEFVTDALAGRPSRLDQAQWLLERSMRVRLPSRALVVDDSATMRSIVKKTLAATRLQFQVSEAHEGFAALKLVESGEFDIVFLDYNMPGFSGLETLSEFKREKRDVTVVMITSAADAALAERARELGAAFLRKPFFPIDIERSLCSYYGLRAVRPAEA